MAIASFEHGESRYNRGMVSDPEPYVPFSQRTGLEPIPPQLKLGEVSAEMRRLLDYYIGLEVGRESHTPDYYRVFRGKWRRVAMDLHVLFFRLPVDTFDHDVSGNKARLDGVIQHANIGELFDLVEFLIRHPGCSGELKGELADAFVMARAAYRVFDNKYIAAIARGSRRQRSSAPSRMRRPRMPPPHASS